MTMISSNSPKGIVGYLYDYRIVSGPGNTVIACQDARKVDIEDLKSALESEGYAHVHRSVNKGEGEVEVTLLLEADAWTGPMPEVFTSVKSLWESCRSRSGYPSFFLIPDELRVEAEAFIDSFAEYLKVRKILEKIADYTTDTGSVLIFHNKKDAIRKEEVSLNVDYHVLVELELSQEKNQAVDSLLQCVSLDEDAHSHERENVLKNVLVEELEKNGFTDFFPLLYHSSCSLFVRYKEQYKIYIDRFSVNRILNDISEKNLEYSSKLNEFVSSGQTKAFAIPGAVIAIGALIRAGAEPFSLILIVLGLFMIKEFVISANQVYRESFDQLLKQISYTFDRFCDLDDSTEVHKHAGDAKSELAQRIEKAKGRVDDIDFYSKLVVWGGMAFLVYSLSKMLFC